MRLKLGLITTLVTVLIAGLAYASASPTGDCIQQRCVYVPLIQAEINPTITPTPTPNGVPFPDIPCDQNAPGNASGPENGIQAWMTVPHPARFSNTTVCARLFQQGHVVAGAPMSAVAHYKSKDTDLGSTTAGADGVGHITFNIGGAPAGFTVAVDLTIGGQSASTSFTP